MLFATPVLAQDVLKDSFSKSVVNYSKRIDNTRTQSLYTNRVAELLKDLDSDGDTKKHLLGAFQPENTKAAREQAAKWMAREAWSGKNRFIDDVLRQVIPEDQVKLVTEKLLDAKKRGDESAFYKIFKDSVAPNLSPKVGETHECASKTLRNVCYSDVVKKSKDELKTLEKQSGASFCMWDADENNFAVARCFNTDYSLKDVTLATDYTEITLIKATDGLNVNKRSSTKCASTDGGDGRKGLGFSIPRTSIDSSDHRNTLGCSLDSVVNSTVRNIIPLTPPVLKVPSFFEIPNDKDGRLVLDWTGSMTEAQRKAVLSNVASAIVSAEDGKSISIDVFGADLKNTDGKFKYIGITDPKNPAITSKSIKMNPETRRALIEEVKLLSGVGTGLDETASIPLNQLAGENTPGQVMYFGDGRITIDEGKSDYKKKSAQEIAAQQNAIKKLLQKGNFTYYRSYNSLEKGGKVQSTNASTDSIGGEHGVVGPENTQDVDVSSLSAMDYDEMLTKREKYDRDVKAYKLKVKASEIANRGQLIETIMDDLDVEKEFNGIYANYKYQAYEFKKYLNTGKSTFQPQHLNELKGIQDYLMTKYRNNPENQKIVTELLQGFIDKSPAYVKPKVEEEFKQTSTELSGLDPNFKLSYKASGKKVCDAP